MGSVKEKLVDVAEKLVDCGGRPSTEPCRENVYPQNAFIPMRGGKWQEVSFSSIYGCCDTRHHQVYWSLDDAKKSMRGGDWIIEYVPVARYKCKTEKEC